MFKFVKNLGKKNKIVSTEFMSWDEFVKEIEPRILDAWTNHELVEKAGVVGLFTEDVKITKDLSYEELCDCILMAGKMAEDMAYTTSKFSDRAAEQNFTSKENYQKYLNDKMAGKVKGSFTVRDDFFSAKTIVDILNEQKTCERTMGGKMPITYDDAKQVLNNLIGDMMTYKKMFFIRLNGTLIANSAIMTGFED